ncbi:MAG: class I SAM-dependent methyltransferase [Roseomonas sp.]|nr:class I SAM-dependent methyltransferase [Roseomonas sp.]MCA3289940.1 class I SAM-dependent methyltransferase [Roseomonas sp.]MCA3292929.1 class I SAM-dependent methyltransferase [Roseomonas sp.]
MAFLMQETTKISKTFREVFEAQEGKVSDKWDSYLSVYDDAFATYKDRDIALLEIGIQNGGSLEVHARYFANHSVIVGCDIHPLCGKLVYPGHDKIKVVVGDANAEATRNRIEALSAEFDVIIDDGSHKSNDIIRSFLHYYPILRKGGTFVVEDLHASYWQGYDGGLFHPSSSMAFLKDLVDVVNLENWGIPMSPQEFLVAKHPSYAALIKNCDFSGIESVHFYNSVCLIKKNETGLAAALGRRRVVGSIAEVWPNAKPFDGALPEKPDQSKNKWSAPR